MNSIHAKNNIVGRIVPFIVLGFLDEKEHGMRRCHATSPEFLGHYQDLGCSSSHIYDSAYHFILSVDGFTPKCELYETS